jgi:hypothetical protein
MLGFFVNGFAPLVNAIDWLKYSKPLRELIDLDGRVQHGVCGSKLRVRVCTLADLGERERLKGMPTPEMGSAQLEHEPGLRNRPHARPD